LIWLTVDDPCDLVVLLPCPRCRRHFGELLRRRPVDVRRVKSMSLRATAPSRATDLHQDALGKARRRGNTKRQDTWRKGLTAAKRKEHNAKCAARKRQRLTEMTAAQLQVYNAKRAAREKQRRKRKAQAAREAERKRKRDASCAPRLDFLLRPDFGSAGALIVRNFIS